MLSFQDFFFENINPPELRKLLVDTSSLLTNLAQVDWSIAQQGRAPPPPPPPPPPPNPVCEEPWMFCQDGGNDCCANEWSGEPAACAPGYEPSEQPHSYDNCPNYVCIPAGSPRGQCRDGGEDCCASEPDGEPAECDDGFEPTRQPWSYENCPNYACVPAGTACNGDNGDYGPPSWPEVPLVIERDTAREISSAMSNVATVLTEIAAGFPTRNDE